MPDRIETADGADELSRFAIRRRLGEGGMGIVTAFNYNTTGRGTPWSTRTFMPAGRRCGADPALWVKRYSR